MAVYPTLEALLNDLGVRLGYADGRTLLLLAETRGWLRRVDTRWIRAELWYCAQPRSVSATRFVAIDLDERREAWLCWSTLRPGCSLFLWGSKEDLPALPSWTDQEPPWHALVFPSAFEADSGSGGVPPQAACHSNGVQPAGGAGNVRFNAGNVRFNAGNAQFTTDFGTISHPGSGVRPSAFQLQGNPKTGSKLPFDRMDELRSMGVDYPTVLAAVTALAAYVGSSPWAFLRDALLYQRIRPDHHAVLCQELDREMLHAPRTRRRRRVATPTHLHRDAAA
jgi:hypothetical protein